MTELDPEVAQDAVAALHEARLNGKTPDEAAVAVAHAVLAWVALRPTLAELTVEHAKAFLTEQDYVVIKAKSYRQAQEHQRVTKALLQRADEEIARTEQWARAEQAEQRRLSERLTYVYGVARARGASHDDLREPLRMVELGELSVQMPNDDPVPKALDELLDEVATERLRQLGLAVPHEFVPRTGRRHHICGVRSCGRPASSSVHDADESVSAAALADEYMRASTMCPGCGQMREVTEDGFVSHHTAYNGVDGPLCGGDDMAAVHMINSDGADQMSVTFEPSDTVAPSTTTEATDATEATPDIP